MAIPTLYQPLQPALASSGLEMATTNVASDKRCKFVMAVRWLLLHQEDKLSSLGWLNLDFHAGPYWPENLTHPYLQVAIKAFIRLLALKKVAGSKYN